MISLHLSAFSGFFELGTGFQNGKPIFGFVLSPELKTEFIDGRFRFDFFADFREGELSLLPFTFDNPVYFKFDVDEFTLEYYSPRILNASFIEFKKSWNVHFNSVGAIWNGEKFFLYTEVPVIAVVSNEGDYHIGTKIEVANFSVEPFFENGQFGAWIGSESFKIGISNWIGFILKFEEASFRFLYERRMKLGFSFMNNSGWIFVEEGIIEGCWKVGRIHVGGKIGKENWTIQASVEF
ncbi:hypothetical protein AS005_05440 [Thermotoga sp. KOL6]|nr:hypothetical protein AS005_05440 [Thermotoga sp. KOL6]